MEGAGAAQVLRNKIRNLNQKVDGLLKSRLKEEQAVVQAEDIEKTGDEKDDGLVQVQAGDVDKKDDAEGLVHVQENEKAGDEADDVEELVQVQDNDDEKDNAEECSTSEDSSGDEFDDEEMAELFCKSLKAHSALDGEQKVSAPKLRGKNERLKEVTWCPNTGLSSNGCQGLPDKLQKKIVDPEKNLQDGLFVPSRNVRKMNKLARENIPDTAGVKWYNMPTQTLTPELKRDLQLIKLRGVLDPKQHYKREDSKQLPKYFQIGTVVEGPTEFYSSRLTRKERKQSIAEELLADSNVQDYRKRKYGEIMRANAAGGKNHLRQKDRKKKPKWAKHK